MTDTLLYAMAAGSPILSAVLLAYGRARLRHEQAWCASKVRQRDRVIDDLRDRLAKVMAENIERRAKLSEAGRKGALIGNKSPKRKRG